MTKRGCMARWTERETGKGARGRKRRDEFQETRERVNGGNAREGEGKRREENDVLEGTVARA